MNRLNHSPELERTLFEYNNAVEAIGNLPPGDLRNTKLFQIGKVKSYLLYADILYRDGKPILDLILLAKEKIKEVLDLTEAV